jgi:hypothetical protein
MTVKLVRTITGQDETYCTDAGENTNDVQWKQTWEFMDDDCERARLHGEWIDVTDPDLAVVISEIDFPMTKLNNLAFDGPVNINGDGRIIGQIQMAIDINPDGAEEPIEERRVYEEMIDDDWRFLKKESAPGDDAPSELSYLGLGKRRRVGQPL